MDGHIGHCCPPACLHTDILTGYSSFTDRTHHALSLSIVMAAIAQLAQGIAARNLVGVEAAAAHECGYIPASWMQQGI